MFLLRSYKKIVFCGFDSWKTEAFFLHLENKEIKITAVSLEKTFLEDFVRTALSSMQILGSRNKKKENPYKKHHSKVKYRFGKTWKTLNEESTCCLGSIKNMLSGQRSEVNQSVVLGYYFYGGSQWMERKSQTRQINNVAF